MADPQRPCAVIHSFPARGRAGLQPMKKHVAQNPAETIAHPAASIEGWYHEAAIREEPGEPPVDHRSRNPLA